MRIPATFLCLSFYLCAKAATIEHSNNNNPTTDPGALQKVTAQSVNGAGSPSSAGSPVVVGYYADWTANTLSPDKVPFGKLTHINYAFAQLGQDNKPSFSTQSTLQQLVAAAQKAGTKVLISIGGWSGSRYFSSMVASNDTRGVFIQETINLVQKNNLDGVDIDWEYPGRIGLSCNTIDQANDAANFLLLLQELRTALDSSFQDSKELTLAVRIAPFDGANGPLSDVSEYAKVVTRINIMAYDINGAWSSQTGPNAPLSGGDTSFVGAIGAWSNANWPKSQMAIGLPFYGRAVQATGDAPTANGAVSPLGIPIVSNQPPQGDQDDAPWADPCPGSVATMSGVWQWRHLRDQNLVASNGQQNSSWQGGWDDASSTPWLWNSQRKIFISYDDTKSIGIKAQRATCNGLAGVMIWDLHQDNGELLDAVHTALNSSCQNGQ